MCTNLCSLLLSRLPPDPFPREALSFRSTVKARHPKSRIRGRDIGVLLRHRGPLHRRPQVSVKIAPRSEYDWLNVGPSAIRVWVVLFVTAGNQGCGDMGGVNGSLEWAAFMGLVTGLRHLTTETKDDDRRCEYTHVTTRLYQHITKVHHSSPITRHLHSTA